MVLNPYSKTPNFEQKIKRVNFIICPEVQSIFNLVSEGLKIMNSDFDSQN